ncbi:DUF4145 domain-containing protein [Clostridium sp. OF09-36]|uniref:DUF4145 domain-containing protein n=1 Tax=Clostridium sp. OF09-36 TaxID=2292310 RepID=UPI000E48F13D|nr:DUF4145 domain-containing protein [Clostridium sp. OF09-36]RHV89285.1 DUF4145 domain-containing protein [Clostridium sp. OF09-36]
MAGGNSSWEKIQQGVNDTERLIVQREYNASMMKARQTLEFMVKNLADQAGILDESDLKNMIDALYENRWISKTTCENYHKIRMIGNKAAHEGDANAYSANQAYHMLSQEMYTFADEYRKARKGGKTLTRPVVTQKSSSQSYTALHERVRRVLAAQIRGILLEQHETAKETQLPQAELMQEHEAAALNLPGAEDVREAGMLPFRFIIC